MVTRLILASTLIVACRTGSIESVPGGPAAIPTPSVPNADVLPTGTVMRVQLQDTLGTEASHVGDRFVATVQSPIVAENGETVVPVGAVVSGTITGLKKSERIGDQAAIRLDVDRINVEGQDRPFAAEVIEAKVETSRPSGRTIGRGAIIGAAAGAALGAIVGGKLKSILIGGVLGAGAGSIISLGMGDVDASLPAGTQMTIRSTRDVSLR